MISDILKLHDYLNNDIVRVVNDKLNNVIKNYSFFYISNETIFDKKHEIYQKVIESKLLIIDHHVELDKQTNELHFIIGLEKAIIIINQSLISFIRSFLDI